jgi:2-polyprenyl-3-methyl-5-hydroxy-6-metoxy-1,4-benzoquinol methylase
MINIITNKHIAADSADHTHPHGCVNDNNGTQQYLNSIKKYFNNKQINVLDLGCAGGQIIINHLEVGDFAVGLEGSSNVFNGAGKHNWEKYYNKNLFLCDITEPFTCLSDNVPILFDVIQMWEVLEHISEDKIDTLFKNIFTHLKDDGIFLGSISQQVDNLHHVSIFSKEKWNEIFIKNKFNLNDYVLDVYPRSIGNPGFSFTAKKYNYE